MKALFDTNIIIDALAGHLAARAELGACADPAISAITFVEVMSGASPQTREATNAFLMRFKFIDVDADICEYAVALRHERRLSLTDAIIAATAQATGRVLITRDKKLLNEFDDPIVRVPYTNGLLM